MKLFIYDTLHSRPHWEDRGDKELDFDGKLLWAIVDHMGVIHRYSSGITEVVFRELHNLVTGAQATSNTE